MSLTAGTRLGRYEIRSAIGAGGMGEVHKAHDTRLHRTVAIKGLRRDVSADPERRAFRARGESGGRAEPPAHLPVLRRRRSPRLDVLRDGTCPWRRLQ